MSPETLRNLIGGAWPASASATTREVRDPATDELLARVPMSTAEEVERAVVAAQEAYHDWRATPVTDRVRRIFRLRQLLEECQGELAPLITRENGKTLDEARGEVRRAIENVEVACGAPTLMQGYNAEDIAAGIDVAAIRQPLGVFVHLAPFNFPAMVPYWFLPYALATGNAFVLKPSPQTPMTQARMAELVAEAGVPAGVLNLVHGDREVAEALMAHPLVKGVTFVGSTPVGREVYSRSSAHGKRALVQGGAKNFLVVMPDADLERTVPAVINSTCGCAGQRCLAGSVVLAVGPVVGELTGRLVEAASRLRVGYGLDEGTEMGPVISKAAVRRIHGYVEGGLAEGAELLLDGRGVRVPGYPNGNFLGPTILGAVQPAMKIAREEIFGPVFGIMPVRSLEECYPMIEAVPYGNAASIFTASGRAARDFASRVACGNIGINVGIAAPIAFFPFGGMRDSFFGVLHGQGRDAVEFFTDKKVVTTRWF